MAGLEDLNDVALMCRVRGDSEDAFEVLHARYQRKLLSFFYGLSGHAPTASDLCQETFLRVWRVRRRYAATGGFRGYLFGIARLIWLEHCRERRKRWRLGLAQSLDGASDDLAAPEPGPALRAERTELEASLLEAISELPEEQRLVFLMRSVEGLSLPEIAEALDCPVNTVRSRRILAVKKLRFLLRDVYRHCFERKAEER